MKPQVYPRGILKQDASTVAHGAHGSWQATQQMKGVAFVKWHPAVSVSGVHGDLMSDLMYIPSETQLVDTD